MRDGIASCRADGRAARYAPAVIILAGVCAALHVGKLPPAIATLRVDLGIGLVAAGFLLSLVQAAGMFAAVVVGASVDRIGLKRCIVLGLAVLAGASLAGACARGPAWLLASRAVESFGFLTMVLAAPPLLRRIVPAARIDHMIGFWGGYMPAGAALGLLVGPLWIELYGWRSWWVATALVSFAALATVLRFVQAPAAPSMPVMEGVGARLARTLSHRGPWLAALLFGAYSSQWLAVIGFLPTIYEQAGVDPGLRGALTALAALVNFAGNVAGGVLLARGVAPSAVLASGYATMAVSAFLAFHGVAGEGLPMAGRYLAVLCFSGVGGIVPATLFALALRLAPDERTVATTVGWMQQVSAFGQFCGPPLVAALAARAGGWHWTWLATGALSLIGLVLAWRLAVAGLDTRRGPGPGA